MTFIKIIFFSLLALVLIASTGIFVFFQVFDTEQYLPVLTQKVSRALGRPVAIGHLGLGLSWRGLTLDAWPVSIADDPRLTSQPFVEVERVRILPDLETLVLKKEFQITDVLIESPQVHFVRSEEGNFNASSIGKPGPSGPSEASSVPDFQTDHRPAIDKKRPFPIIIKSITIKDASISFIDESRDAPLDVWLSHVHAALKDVSISASGDVQANGNIMAAHTTVKDFNIISTILSYVLPLGPDNTGNLFKGRLKDKLAARDTVIENAQCRFSFHDHNVFIDQAMVKTDIFEWTAQGAIDRGATVDLRTMVHLNKDVSDALVGAFEGLKILCDDTGRVAMPASLKGVWPHLKYKPDKDFRKKSRKALMEEGGNILGALLETGSH